MSFAARATNHSLEYVVVTCIERRRARRALAAAVAALGVSACGEQAPPPAPAPSGAAFALLADNRLVKMSLPSGDVIADETAAPRPGTGAARGSLALSRDERTLYVLPRRARPGGELLLVDVASTRVRARAALDDGIVFREIAVGPRSGRVYLVGTRAGRVVPELRSSGSPREQSAVLRVVDPAGGRVLFGATLREAGRFDWIPISAAVSADETRLHVSYHGCCTTGADWFQIAEGGVTRCRARRPADGVGCVAEAHGVVAPFGEGFVAATGGESVIAVDAVGRVRERWNVPLTRRHLMDIALDGERSLYALGDCHGGGGLARIDLADGTAHVLAQPDDPYICGDTMRVGPSNLLVLATQVSLTATPPGLLLVDGETGRVVEQVATDPEPTQVAVTR